MGFAILKLGMPLFSEGLKQPAALAPSFRQNQRHIAQFQSSVCFAIQWPIEGPFVKTEYGENDDNFDNTPPPSLTIGENTASCRERAGSGEPASAGTEAPFLDGSFPVALLKPLVTVAAFMNGAGIT